MQKKAQIKMMETIAVLLVFFMIAAMGLIVYWGYQNKKTAELKKDMAVRDAIRISQTASLLPELQCSTKNIRQDNCIDSLKLSSLKKVLANEPKIESSHYRELFKYASISGEQIFPEATANMCGTDNNNAASGAGDSFCLIYDHKIPKSSTRARTSYPSLIHDPLARYKQGIERSGDMYYFGKMTVDVYY